MTVRQRDVGDFLKCLFHVVLEQIHITELPGKKFTVMTASTLKYTRTCCMLHQLPVLIRKVVLQNRSTLFDHL